MGGSRSRFLALFLAAGTIVNVGCDAGGRPVIAGQATAVRSVPADLAPPAAAPTLPAAVSTPVPAPPLAPEPVPTTTPPTHPLSIATARSREYPGSDLVIEQTLAPGSNYDRYVASYRSEGLKIYALLTVPRGARPPTGWPVVVFNHGYIPPAQYRTTERYVAYTDAFSRSGYVLLRPDYRGHGSSEGIARGGYGSPDYVVDVLNALETVRRHPDVDPERVGMWGHSMGGYIALRAMVVTNTIKAGVIWGGVVGSYPDLLFNWFGRSPLAPVPGISPAATSWRRQLLEQYGVPEQNPGFWASISANTYLTDLSGPVQLHHGTADAEVPVQWSVTLERQIREAGAPVELHTYPSDNHDISGALSTALSRSVAFFDAHVKQRSA